MGDNTALTELAGVAEADTESAYAWALDYDNYQPGFTPRRFTPRRITDAALAATLILIAAAGVVAVLGIRGMWHVDPPVVAAPEPTVPMATVVPTMTVIAQPSVTVTVQAPTVAAPAKTLDPPAPDATGITPEQLAAYDHQFVLNLQARGWAVWDPAAITHQGHQACGMLQDGLTQESVAQHFAGGPSNTPLAEALAFVTTATQTYPSCP